MSWQHLRSHQTETNIQPCHQLAHSIFSRLLSRWVGECFREVHQTGAVERPLNNQIEMFSDHQGEAQHWPWMVTGGDFKCERQAARLCGTFLHGAYVSCLNDGAVRLVALGTPSVTAVTSQARSRHRQVGVNRVIASGRPESLTVQTLPPEW